MFRAILTNDDGIDAPGLAALMDALWDGIAGVVIAPMGPCSGCGHAVTTHQPIAYTTRGERRFAVDGTPADCVRVGIFAIEPEAHWVVSGINAGANLGCDVFHSGTAAAAREAALRGRAAMAISQLIVKGHAIDWPRASRWARRVFYELRSHPLPPGSFWNVNLPHLTTDAPEPEIVFCPFDPSPLPLAYRTEGNLMTYNAVYSERPRRAGGDVATCFNGAISVTRVDVEEVPPAS